MYIIEVSTGKKNKIEILPLVTSDFKLLSRTSFFFDWRQEAAFEIYKLMIQGQSEIQGLVSLERMPNEWRVHIRLLTVSIKNKGKDKIYDRVAGNLIAHAAKIAVREYGILACVSLRPKSVIAKHYIEKYDMNVTGNTLSIMVPKIANLINRYDQDN
jgi:hypothetical protein